MKQSMITSYTQWLRAVGGGCQSLIFKFYSPPRRITPNQCLKVKQLSESLFWVVPDLTLHSDLVLFCLFSEQSSPFLICPASTLLPAFALEFSANPTPIPSHQLLACDFSPPSWLPLLRLTPSRCPPWEDLRTLTHKPGQTWRVWSSGQCSPFSWHQRVFYEDQSGYGRSLKEKLPHPATPSRLHTKRGSASNPVFAELVSQLLILTSYLLSRFFLPFLANDSACCLQLNATVGFLTPNSVSLASDPNLLLKTSEDLLASLVQPVARALTRGLLQCLTRPLAPHCYIMSPWTLSQHLSRYPEK